MKKVFLLVVLLCGNLVASDWIKPTNNPSVNVLRIEESLERNDVALLSAGNWEISRPIVLDKDKWEVKGVGRATKIKPTEDFEAFFLGGEEGVDWCSLQDMMIIGGKHGIKMHNSNRCRFSNIFIYNSLSHGFYVERTLWICSLTNVDIIRCGGDAVHSVGGNVLVDGLTHPATGNALSLVNCNIEHNYGSGVAWCATGLNLNGCCIEGNGGPGLEIIAHNGSALSINVSGNYFESNGHSQRSKGEIHFSTLGNYRINFIEIAGNNFSTRRIGEDGTGGVILSCDTEFEKRILRLCWRQSNQYSSRGVPMFLFGHSLALSRLEHIPDSLMNMPYGTWDINTVESSRRQPVMVHTFLVDCNQDRQDVVVPIMQLNKEAIVLNIDAKEFEAMNGEVTSFETVNDNNLISAKWTNTGGEITKGKYKVKVIYAPASGWEQDIGVPNEHNRNHSN